MTDKEQIIINGVDVSGCSGYCPALGKYNCIASACNRAAICKQSPNCYYKQLQRRIAECEELKNEYWKLEQGNDFLAEKNSRLKGCFAEIKEIAEPFCNACQEFEPEKKGSNCMYCNYGIILRKISEVEK